MNAENKKKLLAIGLPAVGILIMGFILFAGEETSTENTEQTNQIDVNVASVDKKEDVNLDSKTDVYTNEKEKALFDVPKSTYIGEEDFFNVDSKAKEEDFFSVKEKQTPVEEPKQEPATQQKVIVKHVYHNSSSSKSKKNTSTNTQTPPIQTASASVEQQRRTRDGFYEAQQKDGNDLFSKKFAKAFVHNDHSIKSGDKVEFITSEDCVIGGNKIPKNSLLIGISSLQNSRMKVTINSVKVNNTIYPCTISVFDNADGLEGIFLYGSVNQEIAGDAISQAGNQGLSVSVPMIGTVSTGALKKAKDPVVQIPSKTKVLIKL